MIRQLAGTAAFVLSAVVSVAAVARDGDPDPAFDEDGRAIYAIDVTQPFTDLAIGTMPLPDGRMLVIGTVTPAGPDGARIVCLRIAANGAIDFTYGPSGYRTLDTPFNNGSPGFVSAFGDSFVLWGTRGYPLAANAAPGPDGNTTNTDVLVMQVRTDCTIDTTFGDGGSKRIPFDVDGGRQDIATAAFMGDTPVRIFVAAAVDASTVPGDRDFGVAVLTLGGQLDTTYSGDGKSVTFFDIGGANLDVPTSIYSRSGAIVVTGTARRADGNTDLAIARMTGTGNAEASFCPTLAACPGSATSFGKRTYGNESPSATNEAFAVGHIGFDGAIYTASSTTVVSPAGNEQLMLAKFNADGTIATAWGGGTGRTVGALLGHARPVYISLTNTGLVVAGSTAFNAFSDTNPQSRMFIGRFLGTTGQGDLGFTSTNNCVLTFCGTFEFVGNTGQPVDARAVHVREIDGRYLLTGYRLWSTTAGPDYDFALARTQGQFIFSDSFE